MDTVVDLLRSNRTQQALNKIDDLVLTVRTMPESKEKKKYLLLCQNERVNLLYLLNRNREAEDLLEKIVQIKEQDNKAQGWTLTRLLSRLFRIF